MNKNKGKWIGFIILLIILLIALPNLSKIIISLLEIDGFKINMVNKEYIIDNISSLATYKGFFKDYANPINGACIIGLIWYVGSFSLNVLGLFKNDETYTDRNEYGSHGTSRWQKRTEIINNYYKDDVGWFIGSVDKDQIYKKDLKAAYIPVNGELNMQVTVIGPPGSKKTTGFVLPNIYHLPRAYKKRNEKIRELKNKGKKVNLKEEMPDLVITDPKSEIFTLTAKDLKNQGYDVHVLDFINLEYGDCFNPLDFIDDDKSMMEIAQGYIDSVEKALGGGGSKDTFFPEQEGQVLAALIGFLKQKYSNDRTMHKFLNIAKILTSEDVSDVDMAKNFFKANNITGAAEQLWDNFLMVSEADKTRASILGGLATRLKLFAIDGIQNITSKTTVDISKLGMKKENPMALFILMPDGDRTFAPIINVIVSTIFKQLYKNAYKTKNKLENPVYFIIEEMANIGKINNIQEMLGGMRGRRIYPMMIWQSLAQMKDRYRDGWEDILSMCDSRIFLGINDEFTSKYCSNALGDTTIRIQGVSKNADNGILKVEKKSENQSYQQRKLLLPDECARLSNAKLIFIQRANNPVLMYKVQYKYWELKNSICDESYIENLEKIKHEDSVNTFTCLNKEYESEENKDKENALVEKNNNDTFKVDEISVDVGMSDAYIDEDIIKRFEVEENNEEEEDFEI